MNFRHGDPAGVMFNGNLLDISHDLLEEFLIHIGISWKDWFRSSELACPIRNCNIDFLAPFIVGETYDVEINLNKIGHTSFTIGYKFFSLEKTAQFEFNSRTQASENNGRKKMAVVSVTHVFIDLNKKTITAIPEEFKNKLAIYLS